MALSQLLDDLIVMARPVRQDHKMDNYCRYINMALSAFGQERCMVVGSTKEETRLRTRNDQGDYDILVIGDITVPVECLKYREDLPCFVHIIGTFLKDIGRTDLIDGEYLPATLVKRPSSLFFSRLKCIFDLCCRPQSIIMDGVPRLSMATDIKPGTNVTDFLHCHSDLLTPKANPGSALDNAFLKKFTERVNDSEMFQNANNDNALVLQAVTELMQKSKILENSESHINQMFITLLSTLGQRSSRNKGKEDNSVTNAADGISDVRNNIHEDHRREETTEIHCVTCGNTNAPSTDENVPLPVRQKPAASKSVRMTYTNKSMKDYIPALRLSGPPRYIDEWIVRTRYWPHKQTVDIISKSQFFVVAKPAVKDEQPDIDFCLSCNMAEIILAKEMPPGHRKCLLMIKAFQRSILEEYSGILTTFHWKTAMYWMLESTNPATYSETSEDVLSVLRNLLDYMRDRLHEGTLQHYFFPSNLFAGLERCIRAGVVKKIEEIYLKPVSNLQASLVKVDKTNQMYAIDVPLEKMMEMKTQTEKQDEYFLNAALDVIEKFGRPHSLNTGGPAAKLNFPNLVLKIVESVLTDEKANLVKENSISEAEQCSALKEIVMSNLADLLLKKEETHSANRKRAEETFIENLRLFFSLDI